MTIDGKLLRYYGPVAGDNGHIILQPDGPACTAGCHGCAEALVSAPAIERAYLEQVEHPSAGSIREVIAAGASPARAVISAAVGGDPLAVKLISEMAAWLGQWLASLAATYLPQVIVICGGVSACGETLRQPAERRMRQLTGPEYARCEVLVGKFLGNSGVIGAIIPFLMERSLD
jgi:glucokinase